MPNKKIIIGYIVNILFVVILAKILPYFIKTNEYKIERALMIYFAISLIIFLWILKKENKNA